MFKAIDRRDGLAALLLLLPPLLLFWSVTLGPKTLLPVDNLFTFEPWLSYREELGVGQPQNQLLSDLILENYVWKKFIRETLAEGQLPLWNPYILSGQPFLANGQHSAMYPFSLIFYILPLSKAYGWFTVSQLWLAGLGMYIFLRTLRVGRFGAVVAGLTYSLSGFFITRVVFTMVIAGAVWLPLLLALIEIIIRKQEEKGLTGYSPIPYVVAGAATLGVQTLAGHVEITYYTLLVSGFYALCRLLILWQRQATFRFALRLGVWLLAMVLLGVSLGAAQLGPMYEIVTQNFRDNSVTLAQVRDWALPLRRLISFVIPGFFGSPAHHGYFDVVTWQWQPLGLNANGQINPLCPHCTSWDTKTAVEAGAYVGILPLTLALIAVIQAITTTWNFRKSPNLPVSQSPNPSTSLRTSLPTSQSPVFIFTLLAIVSLLFAFGTPLYAILFYGLPGWNQLHSPFRWIFPYTLSLAVLAGFGASYLEQWISGVEAQRKSQTNGDSTPSQPPPARGGRSEVPYFRSLASLLFFGGVIGTAITLTALFLPAPFIQAASLVFERSGLAQNAFADGRQFFGYQWPNFLKFFLMVGATGGVLWLAYRDAERQSDNGANSGSTPSQPPPARGRDEKNLPPTGGERGGERSPHTALSVSKVDATGDSIPSQPPPARGRSEKDLPPSGGERGGEKSLYTILFAPLLTWQALAIILIAADLLLAGWNFNPSVDPALLDFKPRLVEWLEARQVEDPFFRVNSFDTPEGRGNKIYQANVGMFSDIFDVRGYDSIIPAQYARFMQLIQENGDLLYNRVGPLYSVDAAPLDSALLDLLGVRYLLTAETINNPGYELVYDDEIRVYENSDALPRAFLVPEAVTVADFDKPANLAMDAWAYALRSLNPRQQVILDDETNGLGRDLTPADAASVDPELPPAVEISNYTPLEVTLIAQTDQPRWLILADSYFPGWRAYATPLTTNNDQSPNLPISQSPDTQSPDPKSETELTIHRANGNFRAVYLQPGAWQIRFRYSPRSFQLGLYGSFLAGVTLMFLLGYWTWGKLYRESEADSPIKRIAKNSLVPMVMAVSNRLIDFAFALLMLRILQPEGAGKYAFAVAFIGLTEILTRYGLGTLVTREVAADQATTNRYLSNVTILRLYLWLAALPLMTAVLGIYAIYGEITTDVLITVALLTVSTLLSNFSDGLTAIFYAHEKAEYPAGIASITTLSRVSVGALVLILGWGIIGLAGASLFANGVAFVTLSYILITKIYRPTLERDGILQREMMGESFPLMINHLLSTIFFRIDVFILQPTWGSETVGFYNAAYKYVDGINIIPQYFTLAIFPLMSRFAASSRDSLIRAYLLSLRLLLILAIPIAVGTPFIARELIFFLAGDGFLPDSMIVLQLLIWFLPFSFINQVTQYVLIAINQQRHLTRAFIIGVLFNLITNLIFIPFYGYRAAAITTILSEWALLIPFYLLVREHLCTVPWFDVAWRPVVAAGLMGAALWLLGDLNFITTVVVATGIYFGVLALVGGFNQPDMSVIWRAIPLNRLRRRVEPQPSE